MNSPRICINVFILILLTFSFDVNASPLPSIFPEGLKPGGFVFTLMVFSALITALAVHELGHLLTGLALGFRFELFVVFLLGIKRTDKGIKAYFNKNLGYMGGITAIVPTTQSPGNRKKFAWIMLAGPLASLLLALVSFLFLIYTRNILFSFWLIASATSIGLFFATTIPKKSGVFFTDRARFQRLISEGPEGKSEEALLQIIAQTTIDNSFANISLSDVQILQQDKETFIRFWGYYYEYQFFKENKDILQAENARENILKLKDDISKPIWKALKIEE